MNTLPTLLSLAEQRIQVHNKWVWQQQQAPLFLHHLRDLGLEEAQLLSQRMLTHAAFQEEEHHDTWSRLLAQINLFVPGALVPVLPTLVEHRQFDPGHLYLGAGKQIGQQVLELLQSPATIPPYHLLSALAWIGNEAVQAQFHAWRLSPPDWRLEHFPPENSSLEAGWELTADGRRRDLYSSTCFDLVPVDPAASFHPTLEAEKARQERCSWCQRPLRRLLDLDLRDPRCQGISAEGERLCLAICERCSCYATIYLDITLTGDVHWSPLNGDGPAWLRQVPDDGEEGWSLKPFGPGLARRTPFEAIGRLLLDETGMSQLGGIPEWIQDVAYPQCPTCQQTMPCVGQVALEDWEDLQEGIFYLFLCLPCRKAATVYQQT